MLRPFQQETPGYVYNLKLLSRDKNLQKTATFGSSTGAEWLAANGIKPFFDKPIKVDWKWLYSETLHGNSWFVTTDPAIKTVADPPNTLPNQPKRLQWFADVGVRAVHPAFPDEQTMTFAFALYLFRFGLDAALNVPGKFWELGGLPKKVPMMVLPVCGTLLALLTASNIAEDLFGWRSKPA